MRSRLALTVQWSHFEMSSPQAALMIKSFCMGSNEEAIVSEYLHRKIWPENWLVTPR